MNLINTAKSNASSLLSAVKELIEYAKFNKSFKAKIVEILSNGKYKILYKNIEYPATSEYQHSVGDSVWVCAPCNNWNELHIQSGNQSDNTELINRITELNSEVTELETEITTLKTQLTQTNSNLSYQPGDVINLTGFVEGGFLTTSNTDIVFLVPLPKILNPSRTIVNGISGMDVRHNGNYLRRIADGVDNLTFTFTRHSAGLTVRINKADGWGGTNNDVIAVYVTGNLTIQ